MMTLGSPFYRAEIFDSKRLLGDHQCRGKNDIYLLSPIPIRFSFYSNLYVNLLFEICLFFFPLLIRH